MPHDPQPLSAGTPVRALDFPPAQFNFNQTSITNITDTSYQTGNPETAVRFQAPTSGRVAVTIKAIIQNNSAANTDRLFVTFRVLSGDPDDAVVFQTDEVKNGVSNAAIPEADEFRYACHTTMVSGLTPGEFYYARVRHRTTLGSGTADIGYRHILVFPIP
jgi:hypothetical protein